MCLSAPVSFIASAALGTVGVAILARRPAKRLLPLALIPFGLAIQQAAEGFVWLDLPQAIFAKNLFLFFAFTFWPIWVPLALWIAEKQQLRKQLLSLCCGIGLAIGIALGLLIPETTAKFYSCSIQYANNFDYGVEDVLVQILYPIAIIAPLFLSSIRRMWILGALLIIAGAAVLWIDQLFFVSMWCFLAAVVSLSLYFILKPSSTRRS